MIWANRVLPVYIGTSGNCSSESIAYSPMCIQVDTTKNIVKFLISHIVSSIRSLLNRTLLLNEYLSLIETLDEKIKLAEKLIGKELRRDEICRLLETLPGVGKILAVTIRYEIDDIGRFLSAQKLCSYAGLVPSTYSSGGKTYQGKITKQGNRWLRWAMIEAAQQASRIDPWLAEVFQRIEKKGKKKARVAVARKLLGVVYRVWNEKRPYEKRYGAVALPL